MKQIILGLLLLAATAAQAQFSPQAGIAGSDAVPASSTAIVNWATACTVQRGLQQIGNAGLGYAQAGDSSLAIGMADGSIVSLGDSGVAVLTFSSPITNRPGADFAVFENGFLNPNNVEEAFLELAFVEVSSDGSRFFRFPATSLTPTTTQLSSILGQNYMDARLLNNLAGKHISGFGTPFDLQELAGISGLDINRITHVRIVDVIGSINEHSCMDSAGRKINDPYPTAFPTGGFDLDAVGVLHQLAPAGISVTPALAIHVFPNPVTDKVQISAPVAVRLLLTDAAGRVLSTVTIPQNGTTLSLGELPTGIYYLTAKDENGNRWTGKVSKY